MGRGVVSERVVMVQVGGSERRRRMVETLIDGLTKGWWVERRIVGGLLQDWLARVALAEVDSNVSGDGED